MGTIRKIEKETCINIKSTIKKDKYGREIEEFEGGIKIVPLCHGLTPNYTFIVNHGKIDKEIEIPLKPFFKSLMQKRKAKSKK